MKEALKVAIGSVVFALLMCASYRAKADDWTGQDKTLHFAAGAGIASAVTLATDSPAKGFAAGVAVGLAKEVYDTQRRERHTPSVKDFLVTAAGAGVGSWATGVVICRDFVGFQRRF